MTDRITRRHALRAGLLGGASFFFSMGCRDVGRRRSSALPPTATPQTRGSSPRLTPFVVDLPIPAETRDVPPFAAPDCAEFIGPGTRFFRVIEEERLVRVHPDLPPTAIWGYRDANVASTPFALGPTFKVRMADGPGEGAVVRFENQLPPGPHPFGVARTTIHLHGGHHPARSDGFPTLYFGPGGSFDYCFPMRVSGFTTPDPQVTEVPSTLWYHDHIMDHTRENVYRGLVGLYLVFDDLDTGDETAGLRLPSGPFDIPLVLEDKVLAPDGSLVFDVENEDGFLGDTFLVNGAVQPRLRVQRRKYRFRLLNASQARFYQMFLTDDAGRTFGFDQIATEGGLLSFPLRDVRDVRLPPAVRAEIVVDFSRFPAGTVLYLENRLEQRDGRRPDDLLPSGVRMLQLIVEGPEVPDPSRVPDALRPFDPIPASVLAAAVRKEFRFDRSGGLWTINNQPAMHDHVMTVSPLNRPEIWRLVNPSGGWSHPIHIHLEFFRVITRNGGLPPLTERDGVARRETVELGPNEEVEVYLRFRDYPGPYVFHCHNLQHEDLAMMARFDVVPEGEDCQPGHGHDCGHGHCDHGHGHGHGHGQCHGQGHGHGHGHCHDQGHKQDACEPAPCADAPKKHVKKSDACHEPAPPSPRDPCLRKR